RREVLRGELGLALASDGIEIAPDLAGRDRQFGRVVLAQKRCQMRLHDDSGSTDVHGAAFALEYLYVGANAPQGNASAQSTDRAACNRDPHTRLVASGPAHSFHHVRHRPITDLGGRLKSAICSIEQALQHQPLNFPETPQVVPLAENVALKPATAKQPLSRLVNEPADPVDIVTHEPTAPFAHVSGDQHSLDVARVSV